MILSINIPTYNRAEFLKDNIEIIISQVLEANKVKDIEINISDNASTDNTEDVCQLLKNKYKDIIINYTRNTSNLGPDVNFIKAMWMANGDYSILWGDDDYFKEGAIRYILSEIERNKEIGIFLSNRTNISSDKTVLGDQYFFDSLDCDHIFDFSVLSEGKLLFYEAKSLGGLLCFISSVIYKTSIVKEKGPWDERFNGTCYAFHYYWWKYLLDGGKLKYLHTSYLLCTTSGVTNNNYGQLIERKIVDFGGFNKISKLIFRNSSYYEDYIKSPFKDLNFVGMVYLYCRQKKQFCNELYPYLIEAGWNEKNWNDFKNRFSVTGLVKLLIWRIISIVK